MSFTSTHLSFGAKQLSTHTCFHVLCTVEEHAVGVDLCIQRIVRTITRTRIFFEGLGSLSIMGKVNPDA